MRFERFIVASVCAFKCLILIAVFSVMDEILMDY